MVVEIPKWTLVAFCSAFANGHDQPTPPLLAREFYRNSAPSTLPAGGRRAFARAGRSRLFARQPAWGSVRPPLQWLLPARRCVEIMKGRAGQMIFSEVEVDPSVLVDSQRLGEEVGHVR